MDDYLDSSETEQEAATLVQQILKINRASGFEMHSWASNCATIVNDVDTANSQNLLLKPDQNNNHRKGARFKVA